VKSKARTPEEYLAELEPGRRAELEPVRETILHHAPGAEEAIEYGMLGYRVGGETLVALASQKNHLSLYLLETCADPEVLAPYEDELAGLDTGKAQAEFERAAELTQSWRQREQLLARTS
jgi:uncharacterized protein YdhG (YjbR/CyaY superfamily)